MANSFLKRVLEEPPYGWARNGILYRPTTRELLSAWRVRMNLFASRKAWLPAASWFWTVALLPFAVVFLTRYLSFQLMIAGFIYSMVAVGSHGTVYLHRFSTHRAFHVRNSVYLFVLRNLTIKIVPEEIYVVSHHVHHAFADGVGDPYNAKAGWLYCFLAGELHQLVRRDMPPEDYARVRRLLRHTGMQTHDYEQYLSWGSATRPARLFAHYAINWTFWYAAFFSLGGHALATALFGWSLIWALGIRAHNYGLHARGRDRRRAGVDFDRKSLAVNAFWPGWVAGEWHNNHHLFPQSVRSGFLWWQPDSAFQCIRLFRWVGGVTSWRDFRGEFLERHYGPYASARVHSRGARSRRRSRSAPALPAAVPR